MKKIMGLILILLTMVMGCSSETKEVNDEELLDDKATSKLTDEEILNEFDDDLDAALAELDLIG